MKKKGKKWIILAIIVILVAVVAFMTIGKKDKAALSVKTSTLKKAAMSNTVSTTGVVQSTESVNVYTTLNYSIKTVGVKVGDHVKAGDVLCQLDTQDLNDTITQKEASLRSSTAASAQKIKVSEKKYNDSKSNLDAGLNTQINSAQNQVASTKRDLDTALQNQVTAKAKIEKDFNTSLITANANVDTASVNLSRAQKKYNDAKDDYKDDKDDEVIEATYKSCKEALTDAQRNYDNAQKNLGATKAAVDVELSQYQTSVNTAQANYDNAVKSLSTVQASVNQDLQNAQQSIEADHISADTTVQRTELATLRTKLTKCTVTAPTDGTVTAVYAVKNATANGLLFVIEDIAALKISVDVKEYDVGSLKEGMKVIVSSDSTGDDEYEGTLQKISPAAKKSSDGKTVSSSDVEFEADIYVSSKDTRLKIGMNARAEIVVEQKDSVFAVPYDTVTTDAQGKDIIYTAKQQQDGTYKAEAFVVTTGIESDSEVEISGDGLKDGLQIIADSKQITPGETVVLAGEATGNDSSSEAKDFSAMGGVMG